MPKVDADGVDELQLSELLLTVELGQFLDNRAVEEHMVHHENTTNFRCQVTSSSASPTVRAKGFSTNTCFLCQQRFLGQ